MPPLQTNFLNPYITALLLLLFILLFILLLLLLLLLLLCNWLACDSDLLDDVSLLLSAIVLPTAGQDNRALASLHSCDFAHFNRPAHASGLEFLLAKPTAFASAVEQHRTTTTTTTTTATATAITIAAATAT